MDTMKKEIRYETLCNLHSRWSVLFFLRMYSVVNGMRVHVCLCVYVFWVPAIKRKMVCVNVSPVCRGTIVW